MSIYSLNIMDASNKVIDCYQNEYEIIKMLPSGFCGFHALSYCLTGNQLSYVNVIDDCLNVFANIPELFRLRTNFGGGEDSSLTLSDYAALMQDAIQQVQLGFAIHTDAWCEDAHLAAMSLLYDIAIFTYSVQTKEWHVFNESATRGFISLLNSPGHFDVLNGTNSNTPAIPYGAKTHAVNRQSLNASDAVWLSLQSQYSFELVHALPEQFTGVNILNAPLVLFQQKRRETMSTDTHAAVLRTKSVQCCDFPGCNYTSSTAQGLRLHRRRVHEVSKLVKDHSVKSIDRIAENGASAKTSKAIHSCDISGCNYVSDKAKRLQLHRLRVHKVKNGVSKDSVDCNTKIAKNRTVAGVCTEDLAQSAGADTDVDCSEAIFRCDFPNCNYTCSKQKSLSMHYKIKIHRKEAIFRCDFRGCNYTCSEQTLLKMHKSTSHIMSLTPVYNSEEQVDRSQFSDVEADDISVASLETNCSKTIESIPKKRRMSFEETVQICCPLKKGRYSCDVFDYGSVHDAARGLAIHRAVRHSKRLQADDMMSVESDTVSVSSVESSTCSVRRSTRIQNRNKACAIAGGKLNVASDIRREMQSTNSCEDINVKGTQTLTCNHSDSWQQNKATNTRMDHLKSSFSRQIAKLEKEFLPRKKVVTQTDPLYDKLKDYHDVLIHSVSNTTTEKLTSEVIDVILNPTVIDDCDRRFLWSKDDQERLNTLNKTCKLIQPRNDWTWNVADDSEQGEYNDQRLALCVTKECDWKLIECENCGATGLLVGDQMDSQVCYDCMKLKRVNEKEKRQKQDAWKKVQPAKKEFPKAADGQDLPYLQAGDKAVIAPVHPVVTVKKNHYADRRLRIESISLLQDPLPTWCKVLPRTSLADRYMIIERRVQNAAKYIVANADRVRQWLQYLFRNHKEFIRLKQQNQLYVDENAIQLLGSNLELAEVDSGLVQCTANEAKKIEEAIERDDDGLTDSTATSGFSESHVFSFDRYEPLYLKSKDVLRIRKEGKLEIIEDPSVRKPTYCVSANLAFPHLYPHGEMSPLDFGEYKLARYLLKKQALYAHRMSDGRLQWNFAEDDIHMAHQYSRLSEQTVRATVGYYVSSHPSVAHVPLDLSLIHI